MDYEKAETDVQHIDKLNVSEKIYLYPPISTVSFTFRAQ